jgi:hypothetical protein
VTPNDQPLSIGPDFYVLNGSTAYQPRGVLAMVARRHHGKWIIALTAAAVLILAAGTVFVFLHRLADIGEQFAMRQTSENVGDAFCDDFPDIYHNLVEMDGYRPVLLRVQPSLGGRFGQIVLRRTDAETVERELVLERITAAFEPRGWRVTDPQPLGSLKEIFRTDAPATLSGDLQFAHERRPDDPEHCYHCIRIFISPDGTGITAYCEMGW